jgi:AcrR family transcriptional regulator
MTTLSTEKDTKSTLLDCAERLFLVKGFEAVSVREITDAAGANVAAVNYHFTSKTQLYRACLERRLAKIACKRVALIERFSNQETPSTLQEIISAFVRDSFEEMLLNPDGGHLLQIIYREMSPAGVASDLVTNELIAPVHKALINAIHKIRPTLPEKHLSRCVSSLSGQILHFIRFREVINTFVETASEAEYIDEVTQHITEFSLRGIGSQQHV